ncbi:hypothetical protein FOCC_FOCC015312 [Frankliniella occidentalis]|nr:hypothetical protein FOCC_FOCC015312 [Frankliniella occidentalis]
MNTTTKTALIVDICCPCEERYHALEVARRYKEDKYEHLVQHLHGRGFEAAAAAIVVGSLGSWDPANNPVLTKLGVPKFRQNKLKRKCVSDDIRWSRDIDVEHVTQQRQFTQNVTLPATGGIVTLHSGGQPCSPLDAWCLAGSSPCGAFADSLEDCTQELNEEKSSRRHTAHSGR